MDFCQPAEPKYYDDIAAAVAACGLLELASLVPDRQDEYLTPALKMLHALDDTADWDESRDGYLQYCSATTTARSITSTLPTAITISMRHC